MQPAFILYNYKYSKNNTNKILHIYITAAQCPQPLSLGTSFGSVGVKFPTKQLLYNCISLFKLPL